MPDPLLLHVLGSGSATPTTKRNPPAQVLQIRNDFFLIDCGEGTQIALRKSKIRFQRIRTIFISHLHGDHYLGLPGLLSTFNLLRRTQPITIYSPAGLEPWIIRHFELANTQCTYPISFKTISTKQKQLIFENKRVSVFAVPLNHRIETYGFFFQENPKPFHLNPEALKKWKIPHCKLPAIKEGSDFTDPTTQKTIPNKELTFPPSRSFSFAYISDTAYLPKLNLLIKNVDVLFHEATFMNKDEDLAKKTFHSTTIQAALTAQELSAKVLIIGHYSSRYPDIEVLVNECKSIFPNTLGALDGTTFDILTLC